MKSARAEPTTDNDDVTASAAAGRRTSSDHDRVEIPRVASRPTVGVPMWLSALILIACGLSAFWPVIGSQFALWDDPFTIQENANLRPPTWSTLAARWTEPHLEIYVPLTQTVWAGLAWLTFDRATGVMPAMPFKIANVVTHLLASLVVLAIARKSLRDTAGRAWVPLAAALVFCLHPLQVESVAWASGLKDLMCGLFVAIAVFFYIDDPSRPSVIRTRRIALALFAMLLGVLSKPTAMVVPAMLLTIDVLWLRRPLRESVQRLLPFIALAVVCALVARYAQFPRAGNTDLVPLPLRPVLMLRTLAFYLTKLVAPVDLGFDYGLTWPRLLGRPASYLWCLLPIALLGVAWRYRRRLPLLSVGLTLAVLPLLPVSGLVYFSYSAVSIVGDHYVYIPMIGVALAVGELLQRLPRRPLAVMATALTLATLGTLAYRQTLHWQDSTHVARRTLSLNPDSYQTLNHLGVRAARKGDLDEAERLQRESIRIRPRNSPALAALGEIALQRGDPRQAVEWFEQSLAVTVVNASTWYALANAYLACRELGPAIAAVEKGIRVDSDPRDARQWLAELRDGQRRLAAESATRATSRPID